METDVVVALVALVSSLLVAAFTAITNSNQNRSQAEFEARLGREQAERDAEHQRQLARLNAELSRREDEEKEKRERAQLASRFREPLADAAYALQSRLWNILEGVFLEKFLLRGTQREQEYAVDNTVFVIAQYLAWVEIIRGEIHFIDLGAEEKTRELAHLQDRITRLWGSDRVDFDDRFRIWAGEQRAIGEMLAREGPRGPGCIGYGRFLRLLHERRPPLLVQLGEDVKALPTLPRERVERLVKLQHALIQLLDFLDPDKVRFPPDSRTEVDPARWDERQRRVRIPVVETGGPAVEAEPPPVGA